jgi:hypothetical protein
MQIYVKSLKMTYNTLYMGIYFYLECLAMVSNGLIMAKQKSGIVKLNSTIPLW